MHTHHPSYNGGCDTPACWLNLPASTPAIARLKRQLEQIEGHLERDNECPPITSVVCGFLNRVYPKPSKWECKQLLYPVDQPYRHKHLKL